MLRVELGQARRQPAGAEGRRRLDVDPALPLLQVGGAQGDLAQAFVQGRVQRPAGIGEDQPVLLPDEQQMLEEKLRPMGCQIFHDILGVGFNVDHFVVGPTGLFCVETKTHRKPAKGDSRVVYDGETVTVNGFTPDRDPVVQAKAEARWMSDLIEQSTGKRFPVQPMVVYPGWYVETTRPNPDVWVLNDTVAPTFIKNARGALSPEDVSLITFHLKRYVIAAGNTESGTRRA